MDLKLQLAQSDAEGNVIDSQTIEIESGSRLTVNFTTNIQLLREGNPPARVAPMGDDLIIQWEDGEYLVLEPLEGTFDPDVDEARAVSINGMMISGFGNDADQAQLDSFMQWDANYADSPLPWAPLPPYMVGLPEEIEHLPIEEPEEEAAIAVPVEVPAELPENTAPEIEDEVARVSEEGLRGANPDTIGSADTTNLRTLTGTVSVSDADGDPLAVTLVAPADGAIQSGGVPVVWSGSGTSQLVGTAGGNTVVTISIDNAGNYTINLQAALTHAVANVEDEASFAVGVVVSDGLESAQGTLDVIVEDDSPLVDVVRGQGETEALVVDESFLGGAGATDTGNFAGNFTVVSSSYGADQAGSVSSSYVLGIDTSSPTGLVDTLTGNAVVLSMTAAGVVQGHATSGQLVFTLSGDGAGGVTLTQVRAVIHTPDAGVDQPTTLSAANLVTLTRTDTITDADGDTAFDSAILGIGTALTFEDDGPSIDIDTTGTPAALVVDESFLGGTGATDASSFAGNFTVVSSNAGADAPGSVSTSYVLGIDTSSPTGLVDTLTGNAVVLSMTSGGVVQGHATSGELVFTLSGDGAGGVTLTQVRAVIHTPDAGVDQPTTLSAANLVTLTRTDTITDADGDTAFDSAILGIGTALTFEDDGPSIDIDTTGTPAALVVDESFLGGTGATDASSFAGNFTVVSSNAGADAPGSVSTSYVLGIDTSSPTGLVDTLTGNAVVLSMTAAGVVQGHATSGELVFTLSGDGAGGVTLTQVRAVIHTPDAGVDQPTTLSAANLVTLTRTDTITDADGDTAFDSAILGIGTALTFEDDGPSIDIDTTGTPAALVVDESFLGGTGATDASSFAGNFTVVSSNAGADAPGSVSTSYVLGIDTSSPTGLVDTLTGNAVVLSMTSGGVVQGHATSGELVFTLSGDGAGGVTLTQVRAVIHTPDAGVDQPTTLSAANLVTLTRTDTITDADGDTAFDSAILGIGTALTFEDDGPSIDIDTTGTPAALVVDESFLGGTGATDASSFAGNFTVVSSNAGADAPGSVSTSYVLGIDTSSPTGLVDTLTGNAVVLSMTSGGVVQGHATSGELVFTLSGDGAGGVTLTQVRAVIHTPDAGVDQPTTLSAANLVTLTRTDTITDADGDTAFDSAILGIGTALTFEDDGPSIDIDTTGTPAALVVDESFLGGTGATDASSFAGNFTVVSSNAGADAPGSVSTSYVLGIDTSSPTGLVDTLTGNAVVLSMTSGGVVQGHATSGELVFTLSGDGAGGVTLTQVRAVIHTPDAGVDQPTTLSAANLVTLTRTDTITDADGDTAFDSAILGIGTALTFEDDGPSIDIDTTGTPAALVVDESFLGGTGATDASSFAGNFTVVSSNAGADAPGSVSTSYVLGIDTSSPTGLVDTLTGNAVVLSMTSGGVVQGHATSGELVFTLSGDGAGGVTLTQVRAVIHTPDAGVDQPTTLSAANLVTLTRTDTITDADGDTAFDSATLGIGTALTFEDDGPSVIIPEETSLLNAAGESVTADLDIDANIDPNVGADQIGSVRFTNVTDGQTTDYYSDGEQIQLYLNGDQTILYGRINGPTGDEIFRITLQPDGDITSSSDLYEVQLSAQIDNGAGVEFSDLSGTGPAGNPDWKVVESGTEGQDILFTPINAGSVNSDSDDVAVGGQFINSGTGLRIDFADLTLLDKNGDPADPGDKIDDYQFEGHNTVTNFTFAIDQVAQGTYADIELRAFSATDDKDWGNDTPLNITQVDVYDDNGNLLAEATGTGTIGSLDFDFTGDAVEVRGLLAEYQIVTTTDDGYSRLEVMNVGTDGDDGKFSISNLSSRAIISGEDIDMSYDIQLVDADGDSTDASLQFTLEAEEGDDLLSDDAGVEGLLESSSLAAPDASYLEPDDGGDGGEVATVPDDVASIEEPPPAV